MDTKLRKFSRNTIVKLVAFTLTVILLSSIMMQSFYLDNSSLDMESLLTTEYQNSRSFINKELVPAIYYVADFMRPTENSIGYLNEPEYLYYITNGEVTYKNAEIDEIKQNNKAFFMYDKGRWTDGAATMGNKYFYIEGDYTLYLSFPENYLIRKQLDWENNRAILIPHLVFFILSTIVSFVSILYLLCVTGRKPEDDEVHLTAYMDRIYTDFQIIAGIISLMIWFEGVRDIYGSYYNVSGAFGADKNVVMIFIGIITGGTTILLGKILLSLVRHLKAKKIIKHSLIYTILSKISDFIRSFFDDRRYQHFPLTKSLYRRQIIFTAVSAVMVFLTIISLYSESAFILVPPLLEAVIIYWYFRENNNTFDEINKGFNESLEEQMKSERMKVDLITNVSHDLKTPLTSIISYVDLLSKEDLPETSRDYVKILADKSSRLKNIVSDLFDLAKSTSGNLMMNLESIDLKKLIEQTLADMEDEISSSSHQIRAKLTKEPVHIYSDGKKLYRVFQNIISNALKYSLNGTRIFIDMEQEGNRVSVILKNTASYEMDFTADEILQRFNRGDKSRATDGSGLGLSIAESFTKACGGSFKLDIDGDQFKVKLGFIIK